MTRLPPPAPILAGLLAAFVGFVSSFSVVYGGLLAAGASPAEASSGLMALSVGMGLCAILVSWRTRMPISVAWSTPGGALLAGAALPVGGFPAAVGAFLLAGVLVILAGAVRPLGRLIARIPGPLAAAMLAGVLLPICLAPVRAIAQDPFGGLLIAGAWFLVGRFSRLLAVPAAALVTLALLAGHPASGAAALPALASPVLVVPSLDWGALLGIGLPLFLVTMASQNVPGLAVLKVYGYQPAPGPLFAATGLTTLLVAPFGGHAVNLAALTQAICAGDEAGPDTALRWWSGVSSGVAYVAFGLGAGLVASFAARDPLLVQALAGLALVGALTAAAGAMMEKADLREAAVLCFLVTGSGTAFGGISAPFWGLLAGGLVLGAKRLRRA
ncbi:benzoate/H(+) symporter BenE family transporter [Aureimonas sp. AU4]|uniref:benzoate/H(+) symporter BenE family transporter n=1 Tax=Aureimonas sp. AU4 TaxID=1638163 RepID=UPI0007808656|nr:benzoate/H(+) symporter BenE family transporter [Aureimonas sp. AU4]